MGATRWTAIFIAGLAILAGALYSPYSPVGRKHHDGRDLLHRDSMRAAVYTAYGEAENVLDIRDVPVPHFADNDLLIEVHSAALNPVDWKFIRGTHAFVFKLLIRGSPSTENAFQTGFDLAGKVVAVGPGVSGFQVGDEVYAMAHFLNCGSLAEYIAVDAGLVAKKPKTLTWDQAASLPLAGLTSFQALKAANLKEGDRVLILGGSSGTGSLAVQLAKEKKAFVVTTCGKRNFDFCRQMGADQVLDYKTQDWASVLEPKSLDVVYDCVEGGEAYHKSLKVLRPGGHFITIVGDEQKELTVGTILEAGFTIAQKKIRSLLSDEVPSYNFIVTKTNGADLASLKALVEAGKLVPVVDSTYSLEDAKQAFARQKGGHATGKVVVQVKRD